MIVSLIIFISIAIIAFLLTEIFVSYGDLFFNSLVPLHGIHILFSKVANVLGVLKQVNADTDTKDNNNMNSVASRERTTSNIPVGLWTPMNNSFVLQHLKDAEQKKAIDVLLKKGYGEYYYVMNNFEDPKSAKITDKLLDNANKTNLKIIIILLPPSEGGFRRL